MVIAAPYARWTATYSANAQVTSITDGQNNLTSYAYDGHDRLVKTSYPSATAGAGTSSASDYAGPVYDVYGRIGSQRLRDGSSIAFTYDNLGRVTKKDVPAGVAENDVDYTYDNLGRVRTQTVTGGAAVSVGYDALGRQVRETSGGRTKTMAYDLAGRMTRLTYPGGGLYVDYDYEPTGNVTKIRENGATSGIGVLASYAYDSLGRRSSVTFGNGTVQNYGYNSASQLAGLGSNLGGTAWDVTTLLRYTTGGQIRQLERTNDAYAWTGAATADRSYAINGRNQVVSETPAGGAATAYAYDARGNLIQAGATTYGYTSENRLRSVGAVSLSYDAAGRLARYAGSAPDRFGLKAGRLQPTILLYEWTSSFREPPTGHERLHL